MKGFGDIHIFHSGLKDTEVQLHTWQLFLPTARYDDQNENVLLSRGFRFVMSLQCCYYLLQPTTTLSLLAPLTLLASKKILCMRSMYTVNDSDKKQKGSRMRAGGGSSSTM